MRELSTKPHYDCDDKDHSLNDSTCTVLGRFSEKSRLWALTYVCIVAVQAVVISGYSLGFTSPVLSKLKDVQGGNKSLKKIQYQDIFNVCIIFISAIDVIYISNSHVLEQSHIVD